MQFDLFEAPEIQDSTRLPLQDAEVDYFPCFLNKQPADKFFGQLRNSLEWRQETLKLYGKTHQVPRLQAWYGDPESSYQYSGLYLKPKVWTKELLELKTQCEQISQHPFNAVLANLYRYGSDSMGWHADDEPELGKQPVIASLSLGEIRNFDFKHKNTGEKYRLALAHGSLLIMAGTTQQFWQHGIAKTRVPLGERINLTFRYIF